MKPCCLIQRTIALAIPVAKTNPETLLRTCCLSAFYLLFGPLVGAAVGAGTMAYMDRGNHGSQMEANRSCQQWMNQKAGISRHCIDDEPTRQVLGWQSPETNLSPQDVLDHPQVMVAERFRY